MVVVVAKVAVEVETEVVPPTPVTALSHASNRPGRLLFARTRVPSSPDASSLALPLRRVLSSPRLALPSLACWDCSPPSPAREVFADFNFVVDAGVGSYDGDEKIDAAI